MSEVTISALIGRAAQRHGQSTALEDAHSEERLSYAELASMVNSMSLRLSRLISPGRRVAVLLESGFQLSTWLLATMWRHAVIPLNPSLAPDELRRYLTVSSAALVIGDSKQHALRELCVELRLPLFSPADIQMVGLTHAQKHHEPSADQTAAILLTSGSTGTPKVVPLTQENLSAGALNVVESLRLSPGERCLVLWAQHHIGGLVDLLLAPLFSGGTVVNAGRFSVDALATALHQRDPDWIQFVPTTLDESTRALSRGQITLGTRRLRFIRCVAAPMPAGLWERAEKHFDTRLVHTYGLTEASPLVASTPVDAPPRVPGSSGRPVGIQLRIVDSQGHEVPIGQTGEVVIRGRSVFAGYELHDASGPSHFFGGWFRTGDIGYLDTEGNLFLAGREKHMINRGGEKINPAEVENVLREFADVEDVAVFPVVHARLGQAVAAAITASKPIDTAQLQLFAASRLSAYKVPSSIVVLPELPRNDVGKIDIPALSEAFTSGHSEQPETTERRVEQSIAEIWREELDLREVDLNTPFVMAGGDSLSAVRVVAEIERRLGAEGLSESLMAASTVAEMANLVRQSQTSPAKSENRERFLTDLWNPDLMVKDAVALIGSVESPVARLSAQHLALTHFTPTELGELQHLLRAAGVRLSWSDPFVAFGMPNRSKPTERTWVREKLSEQVLSYHREGSAPSAKTLIAFTGNQMRLMLPLHIILTALPRDIGRVVVLADVKRTHYRAGIPGISSDAEGIAGGLRNFLPTAWFDGHQILGTSAGALVAAITGTQLGTARVALVGPDAPQMQEELSASLRAVTSKAPGGITQLRIASGNSRRDREGMRALRGSLSGVRVKRYWFANHNVFHYTYRQGRLPQLLRWLIGGVEGEPKDISSPHPIGEEALIASSGKREL